MHPKSLLVTVTLLLVPAMLWGAAPEANAPDSLPTFRITTAEVHVDFTAVRNKNQVVNNLSPSDFKLLKDGRTVDQVSLEKYDDAPISALVLTDVSDSMTKAIPMERASADWLRSKTNPTKDRLSFADFGEGLETQRKPSSIGGHLTSVYDALFETLMGFGSESSTRREIILLTDGIDNNSLHSLPEVITLAQRFDIALYAITAHPGKNQFYRPDLLRYLCEQTGGKYYEARKLEGMLTGTAAILDELRNGYEVVFRPDATSGMHAIALRPNQPGLRFYYRAAYFQPETPDEVASGE